MIFLRFSLLAVFPIVYCLLNDNVSTIYSVVENIEKIASGNGSQYANINSSSNQWPAFYQVLQMVEMLNAAILTLRQSNLTTPFNDTFMNESITNDSSALPRKVKQQWENCPSCGLLYRNRIVGGRQGSITDFPWTVSIRISGGQHCGGSVINRMYILTAGHCVIGEDVKKFEIIAAATDVTDQKAFKTTVASGKVHERFHSTTYDYDVAVLKLVEPLPLNKGIKPICLPDPEDDPVGEIAVVAGWGALKESDRVAPDRLNKVDIPIISNDECEKAKGMRGQVITDRMLCGGYLDGSKDACIGDSGGPLVLKDGGVWKQIGVVSWGIGCARPGFYGIYSRVSGLLSWIAANTPDGRC